MPDGGFAGHPGGGPLGTGLILLGMLAVTLVWGRVLWYFDDRSSLLPRAVLFALGYTRRTADEVRALLLAGLYYGGGLLASALFVVAFGLDVSALFSLALDHPLLVLLGALAEISLSDLFVSLYCAAAGAGPERFAEMRSIPWMEGLRKLPDAAVPWGAAAGAAVEELFFRGVLITVLIARLGFAPAVAVAIAGALFCLQQLIQVRTPFQGAVIGAGSLAISLVGGFLVVHAGSVLPAILCHCAFVVFYLRRGEAQPRTARS